jgi:hypothetical protein
MARERRNVVKAALKRGPLLLPLIRKAMLGEAGQLF